MRQAFYSLVFALLMVDALTACRRDAQAGSPTPTPPAAAAPIDVKAALAPRSLGNPNAPVKMEEWASLDCPHCAAFEKESFDKLKTDYIDTGKVYYTYNDFPLHLQALTGAMVARCLPPDHYFQFIKFLFDTQTRWVFDQSNKTLREDAKLLGMSDAEFDSCISNPALKAGIVSKMQAKIDDKTIDSTPTFIFNGLKIVHGAVPYADLQQTLDPLVGKK